MLRCGWRKNTIYSGLVALQSHLFYTAVFCFIPFSAFFKGFLQSKRYNRYYKDISVVSAQSAVFGRLRRNFACSGFFYVFKFAIVGQCSTVFQFPPLEEKGYFI
jgi:hypothetical protein